jgi:hypothetical protein
MTADSPRRTDADSPQRQGQQPSKQRMGWPAIDEAEALLRDAGSLKDLLAASAEAFEALRLVARHCEDRAPELLAAFMTCADAAVDGREAVMAAPSITRATRIHISSNGDAGHADPADAADALSALGILLGGKLASAATRAAGAGDRAACRDAALAARRIGQLMRDG